MSIAVVSIKAKKGTANMMDAMGGLFSFSPESSAVKYISYLMADERLSVTYSNGQTYFYDEVKFPTVIQLLDADSVGAFIAKQIKPNYKVTASTLNK